MLIQPASRLNSVKEYYFSTKLKQLHQYINDGREIINLGIGSPDLAPDQSVVNSLIKTAKKSSNHGYQSYVGLPEFRSQIATWYANIYSIELNPTTEILPLLGSKEGIMHISLAFVNQGDKVLIPNPGYPTYASVSKLMEANVVNYNLDDTWQIEIGQLQQHKDAKMMWVNYPHMPSGAKADLSRLKQVVDFCRENQILLVNDNPYSLILNEKEPFSIFQIENAKEIAIELNSMSKSHNMAGWRVGMLLAAEEYVTTVLKVKSNIDSGMFKGTQYAAIQGLSLDQSWHIALNKIYESRREIAWQIFNELNITYSRDIVGLFTWGKVPQEVKNVADYVDEILEHTDVFITPGFIFGSNGERYVRISLCSDEAILQKALARIQKWRNN